MKKILLIISVLAFSSCVKEKTIEPTTSMNVIDITPATYTFLSGRWKMQGYPTNSLEFQKDTFFYYGPGSVRKYFYTLIRNYNMNMLAGKRVEDTTKVDYFPFEITTNQEFHFEKIKCYR